MAMNTTMLLAMQHDIMTRKGWMDALFLQVIRSEVHFGVTKGENYQN